MQVYSKLVFISVLIFIFSCTKNKYTREEYLEWFLDKDNGMLVEKKIGDYSFLLQYQSKDYQILKENPSINKELFQQLKNENSKILILTLELENNKDSQSLNNLSTEMFNYLSYNASKDFNLIIENDTLPCVLYHFEKSFKLGNNHKFLLGFSPLNFKNDKTFTLNFNDKVGGFGNVNISIEKDNLQKIQNLNVEL